MSKADPGVIVKRNEEDFAEFVSTEEGFLEVFGRYDDQPLALETYQSGFLNCFASYRCVEKSRQTGYSFVFALESVARTHLRTMHTSVFVSYNLADAKEKIAYAQQLHEELPLEYQKKKVVDSKLELAFRSNKIGGKLSRIISNPSKAPRGKHGDIYLDELAHCANDREIYKGSTALILRSGGQLTVCSSPLGRRGLFWEIARQEVRPFRAYKRQRVPWWLCSMFCKNPRAAARAASELSTEERVKRFAKRGILEQFDSLPLEDFQQEFEVIYVDETLSFYPYDLILPCTDPDLELVTDFAELERCKGRLVAGFDVGRMRDMSVLTVFEELKGGRQRCVMIRKYEKTKFAHQEADLRNLLNTVKIARLSIDNAGLGMQMAENLSADFPSIVVRENFSNAANKELWCTDFKIMLQKKLVDLPRDADLIREIHSVKKSVTAAGRVRFEGEQTKRSHADTFWSIVLACKRERGELRKTTSIGIRVIGGDKPSIHSKPVVDEDRPPEKTLSDKLFDLPDPLEQPGAVLVKLHSLDESAIRATESTLAGLVQGAHFRRDENGKLERSGSYHIVDTPRAAFVAWAAKHQGYVADAEVACSLRA